MKNGTFMKDVPFFSLYLQLKNNTWLILKPIDKEFF